LGLLLGMKHIICVGGEVFVSGERERGRRGVCEWRESQRERERASFGAD